MLRGKKARESGNQNCLKDTVPMIWQNRRNFAAAWKLEKLEDKDIRTCARIKALLADV